MKIEKLMEAFGAWLVERDIKDVEIEENVGPEEKMTTITFPIDEGGEYVSYDIIASLAEDAPLFFCGEYCDIPDVDELELLRYVNDLNRLSPLTMTVEDGSLCFAYSLPLDLVNTAEDLANAFFFVWDSIDEIRDDVRDAFGLAPEIAEEHAEEESADEEEAETGSESAEEE